MHRSRLAPAAALALVALLAAAPARAGRPLQADDAAVMDPRACELEGAHSQWRQQGSGQHLSGLQLGCGIGWGTELALQALRPRELALNGKTGLAAMPWRDGEQVQFTLAWSLAHRHAAAAWRRSGVGLNLVASLPLTRDWLLHANLGHLRDELQRRRSTTWALAAEHQGLGEGGRWQPMAELFGDDHGRPWANAALRLALRPDSLFVDASLGRQLGGRGRLATAGFKLAF